MSMRINPILNADSYKASHFLQYPPSTQVISSYIESRGGRFSETVFFGLQMLIKEYLLQPITREDIDEAEALLTAHGLPFNREGWEYILREYDGFLPLEIDAAPEGSLISTHNALVQVRNTDPACAWLTSYIETSLLRAIWYPVTVASTSWYCRELIRNALEATADDCSGLPFKLHDFGARGTSSTESAAIGGLAHLTCFQGTDTVAALLAARRYYGEPMAGYSIPATEHSTITSWGRDGEQAAYANLLAQFAKPGAIVACVSDSWDLWHAIDSIWGDALKTTLEQSGGTLVVRPDSGDPVIIAPETIERLMARFGFTENSKGYRVLPPCVRVIQGDGIDPDSLAAILAELQRRKLSVDNLAFGMGGALLQHCNRDTQKFAMKASAACIHGEWRDVFKDPATDPGKRSKPGRLALIRTEDGRYETIRLEQLQGRRNYLEPVYRNGDLLRDEPLSVIRERLVAQSGNA
ncbi:Nicotinic acid phosphoribosyltransferase [gamma proteobacterium HdN1]|nr:Nicotinic acid phosphoribosyltransferase [gamma proteobacterium HdN1]